MAETTEKKPTQIGITASEATSFSTMIGMLVAGSIINPRICISTSSVAWVTGWIGVVVISVQHHKIRRPRLRPRIPMKRRRDGAGSCEPWPAMDVSRKLEG